MGRQPENEEELKNEIFNIYTKYLNDRREVFFVRFHELIIKWYNGYLYNKIINSEFQFIEAEEFLVEIYDAMVRFVKNCATVPKERNLFFGQIKKTLKHARYEHYRNFESGLIHIPKGKIELFKKIKSTFAMVEQNSGKKLSENEKIIKTSLYLGISEDEIRDCLIIMNNEKILSLEFPNINDEDNNDILDFFELNENADLDLSKHPANPQDSVLAPLDSHENINNIKDALKTVFQGKYAKQPFYKSLFTGLCLDTWTEPTHYEWFSEHFEYLKEFLDIEMLEEYKKTGKRPKDLEICLKRACQIFCVNDKISFERNPFIPKLNGELV
jgi:hypothetical protein